MKHKRERNKREEREMEEDNKNQEKIIRLEKNGKK